jgi:copper(I)-binding protein
MITEVCRVLFAMIFALSAAVVVAGTAKADEPPDHHGQIIVEDVWVTPATEDSRSMLHFRITNEGYDHVHLLGVETPVAGHTRIVGRIGDHKTATLDSFGVSTNSSLDLTSGHLWIELRQLTRDLKAGESIPLELVFVRSRMLLNAHVHTADG